MSAEIPGYEVTTDESPLQTLTFHVRTRWVSGRQKRLQAQDDW